MSLESLGARPTADYAPLIRNEKQFAIVFRNGMIAVLQEERHLQLLLREYSEQILTVIDGNKQDANQAVSQASFSTKW
jgi:hypothetical protein